MSDKLIERYFERAADPDLDAYFAQFAEDARCEDEGHLYQGIDEIRAWWSGVPPVTYDVRRIEPTDRGQRAVAEISGDFPGSPVTLAFGFVVAGEKIQELTIRPVST